MPPYCNFLLSVLSGAALKRHSSRASRSLFCSPAAISFLSPFFFFFIFPAAQLSQPSVHARAMSPLVSQEAQRLQPDISHSDNQSAVPLSVSGPISLPLLALRLNNYSAAPPSLSHLFFCPATVFLTSPRAKKHICVRQTGTNIFPINAATHEIF